METDKEKLALMLINCNDIIDVLLKEKSGNLPEANRNAVLADGWRDRNDETYLEEKRIIIFSPDYKHIDMKWRIIDSQFMKLCTDAKYWKKLTEPTVS